jgi:predicted acylesterase/phospholipase RssA
MTPSSAFLCWISIGLLAAACGAPPRPLESAEQRQHRFVAEQQVCRSFYRVLSERVSERISSGFEDGSMLDVLVLSGGGDFGAFGAGFLQGWGQTSDPRGRRPDFDAVFGTSTGALLAPLAYVGTEASLKVGADLYSDPPADLVEQNGLVPIVPWNESLMKPTGLRRTLEQQLTPEMLGALRAGLKKNRALACASTNRQAIVERLLASAAIPGVFPPIELDGSLYVDGGVTANIWAVRDQSQTDSVLQTWIRANPGKTPPKIRIWVIVNNQLFPKNGDAKREWIDLAGRGVSIMLRSTMLKDLHLTAYAALEVDEKMPGEIEFRFIAIPDEWVPPVKGTFKRETMQSLVELGRKLGADTRSWRTTIPNIDDVGGYDIGKMLEPEGRGDKK